MSLTLSRRRQQWLARSAVALLAANALAIPFVLQDGERSAGSTPRRAAESASGVAALHVAVVTTTDGHHYLVDPTTVAGRRAINRARKDGGRVQDVTLPPGTVPGASKRTSGGAATGRVDLAAVVRQLTEGRPTTTVGGGPGGGDGDGGSPLVPILPDDVTKLLGPTVTTITSVVGVVGGVVTTVSSLVEGTKSTIGTPDPVATATTAGSVLAGVVTTVSSLAQSVLTTAPALPPTTVPSTTTSICVALVSC